MNKMQVRTALETIHLIKNELIEEKKKVAEDLAYIEERIEAIMILIPVLMKMKDRAPETKITVPPAHLENLVSKEPEDKIVAMVTYVPLKAEATPYPEAVNIKPVRAKHFKRLTEEERNEKKKIAKHNWYLANKCALDARRKQKQHAKKQMAPEKFGRQFESAAQAGKPNYFGDGE